MLNRTQPSIKQKGLQFGDVHSDLLFGTPKTKRLFPCLFLEGRLEPGDSLEHETQRGNPQSSFCPCSNERVVLMMEDELKETLKSVLSIHLISNYLICPPLATHLVLISSLISFLFRGETHTKKSRLA